MKDKKIPLLSLFLHVLYYFVGLVIALVFTYYGYFFFRDWGMIQESDITGLNLGFIYAAIPIAGLSWFLFLVDSLIRDLTGQSITRVEEEALS